jgi:hypothetical protein
MTIMKNVGIIVLILGFWCCSGEELEPNCEHCNRTGTVKVYEKCSNKKCRHGNLVICTNDAVEVVKCPTCVGWKTDKRGYRLVKTKKCVYCSAWLNKSYDADIDFFMDNSDAGRRTKSTNVVVVQANNSSGIKYLPRLPDLCPKCKNRGWMITRCQNEFHWKFQKKLGSVCPACGTSRGKIRTTCSACNGGKFKK